MNGLLRMTLRKSLVDEYFERIGQKESERGCVAELCES